MAALEADQGRTARAQFSKLTNHYHSRQASKGYKPAALIQATLDYVISKDAFLLLFLSFLYTTLCSTQRESDNVADPDITVYLTYFDQLDFSNSNRSSEIRRAIEGFAEYIVENFLLLSFIGQDTTTYSYIIIFDTVIHTGWYNTIIHSPTKMLGKRFCKDDDRELLRSESYDQFKFLDLANIMPHSFVTATAGNTELSNSKKIALRILDMFDLGIIDLIDHPKIDSPLNALTLTHEYHHLFGKFQMYFNPTGLPHQYTIKSTEQIQRASFLHDPLFPVTRALTLRPNCTIEPPSPRLLGVHRAITCIMQISGAGEYIEDILQDLEDEVVKADGSTKLSYDEFEA